MSTSVGLDTILPPTLQSMLQIHFTDFRFQIRATLRWVRADRSWKLVRISQPRGFHRSIILSDVLTEPLGKWLVGFMKTHDHYLLRREELAKVKNGYLVSTGTAAYFTLFSNLTMRLQVHRCLQTKFYEAYNPVIVAPRKPPVKRSVTVKKPPVVPVAPEPQEIPA